MPVCSLIPLSDVKRLPLSENVFIGGKSLFTLIAGPCAIENESMAIQTAAAIQDICSRLHIPFVFKSSFDKANRSSIHTSRGVGMQEGLRILRRIKDQLAIPIVTDVHETWQCDPVAEVADILQIPAYLSRQTDLLLEAGRTGRAIHVKKGQFMAPWDMINVIEKLESVDNHRILLCERGTFFGYNNLVVDMTSLVEMRRYGYPVVFDGTHSVQKPGGLGQQSGGNREMVSYLVRAALAVGIDGLFLEVHPDPDKAISDGPNQLALSTLEALLKQALELDSLIKSIPLLHE